MLYFRLPTLISFRHTTTTPSGRGYKRKHNDSSPPSSHNLDNLLEPKVELLEPKVEYSNIVLQESVDL